MENEMSQEETMPERKKSGLGKKLVFLVVIAVIIFALFSYFGGDKTVVSELPTEGEELSESEINKLVVAVSKHMLVPEAEVPTIATITNAEALIAQQAFYNGAIDGDRVLLFGSSQRAIIYSPSRDVIVNVGPVILGDQSQQ